MTRRRYLYLTRMTLNELNDLKVDTGRKWLAQFLVDSNRISEQDVEELLLLDQIWQWWHNEWCRLDHSIILPALYHIADDERKALYSQMHAGVLQQSHPCQYVLETGFKLAAKPIFKPFIDKRKKTTRMKKKILLFVLLIVFGVMAKAQTSGRIRLKDDVYMEIPRTLGEVRNVACGCTLEDVNANGCTTSYPMYSTDGLNESFMYRANLINRVGGIMWSALYMYGGVAYLALKDHTSPFIMEFYAGALSGNRKISSPDNDGQMIAAYTGSGSPEGIVIAMPGKIYIDTTSTPGKKLWVKEANATAIGWEVK
jgi:hypothetical protein